MHDPTSGIRRLFKDWKEIHQCLQGGWILLQNLLWGTRLPTQEPRWALAGFQGGFPQMRRIHRDHPFTGVFSTPSLQCSSLRCPFPFRLFFPGVQIWWGGTGERRPRWVKRCFRSSCQGYPSGYLSERSFFRQNAQAGGFYSRGGRAY